MNSVSKKLAKREYVPQCSYMDTKPFYAGQDWSKIKALEIGNFYDIVGIIGQLKKQMNM